MKYTTETKKKSVFILRGIPGAGKSSVAEELFETAYPAVICCADDYFMHNGKYEWDANKIGAAHLYCQNLFKKHLELETSVIIVANTSTNERDVNLYRNLAIEHGYKVFVLTIENWHDGQDVHNVPEEVKENMKRNLKNSIKL